MVTIIGSFILGLAGGAIVAALWQAGQIIGAIIAIVIGGGWLLIGHNFAVGDRDDPDKNPAFRARMERDANSFKYTLIGIPIGILAVLAS